jgi:hypothetical protein
MVTEYKGDPAQDKNLETIVADCEHVDEGAHIMQSVPTGRGE